MGRTWSNTSNAREEISWSLPLLHFVFIPKATLEILSKAKPCKIGFKSISGLSFVFSAKKSMVSSAISSIGSNIPFNFPLVKVGVSIFRKALHVSPLKIMKILESYVLESIIFTLKHPVCIVLEILLSQ